MKQKIIFLSMLILSILFLTNCDDKPIIPSDITPPGEVSNLKATAGDASVLVEWDIPIDEDLAQVQLTFVPTNSLSQPIPLSPEFTSKQITDLQNGVEYTFTIRTVDNNANKSEGVSIQSTPEEPLIVDPVEMTDERNGKVYKIKKIGEQTWMTENLAYLPDGASFSANNIGSNTETFSMHFYAYNLNNGGTIDDMTGDATVLAHVNTYGLLYNWYAAINMPPAVTDSTGLKEYLDSNPVIQGVCPSGWHLPTDTEFKNLEKYLGMTDEEVNGTSYRGANSEGNKLKSEDFWETSVGTNEVGFDLRPSGRWKKDQFQFEAQYAYLWTSTLGYFEDRTDPDLNEYYGSNAWLRYFKHSESRVARQSWEDFNGYAIRCVQDTEE